MKNLLVVDATNILYRSYYGMRNTNLRYQNDPVWAIHGLLNTLASAINVVKPTHFLLAFDTTGGCPERKNLVEGYKQGRKTPEEELVWQRNNAENILEMLPALHISGWEADDILASSISYAQTTHILSGDRDALQLVSANVTVLNPDWTKYTPEYLKEKTRLTPAQYPHMVALRGEKSDNLPGVPKIGEKSATDLVAAHHSLENIEAQTDEILLETITKSRLSSLRENMNVAHLNFKVGALKTDLEITGFKPTEILLKSATMKPLENMFPSASKNLVAAAENATVPAE